METKLILVEGNPFTGKSTLSEHITQQLALNGHTAEWVSEGAMFDQHFPQSIAVMDAGEPISDELLWSEWTAFVETVERSPAIFVVDAAVSYAAVYPLLIDDHPPAAIDGLVRRVGELLAPLRPRMIYLRGDQDQLARASIAARGERWEKQMIDQSDSTRYQQARGRSGLEAAIALAEESQDLMDVVLDKAGWPMLTLDVTGPGVDREANRRAALDFLRIPEVAVETAALSEPLSAYAGTYVEDDPAAPMGPLEVRIEGDELVIFTAGQRFAPLVPVSGTRLHLRGNPIDVDFEVEDGRATRVVLVFPNGRTRAHHRA
ncbi:MAG: hypothetical protein QOG85_1884 [Gaiellaceae bacterium]|jgi:hypothetical protein|nr:hypothetical protein [Gaiellaceae bacterium]